MAIIHFWNEEGYEFLPANTWLVVPAPGELRTTDDYLVVQGANGRTKLNEELTGWFDDLKRNVTRKKNRERERKIAGLTTTAQEQITGIIEDPANQA